jgi:hypothetical protein
MYIDSDYDIDNVVPFIDVDEHCIRLGTIHGLRVEKNQDPGEDTPETVTVYIVHYLGKDGQTCCEELRSEHMLSALNSYTSRDGDFEKLAKVTGIDTPRQKSDRETAARKEKERLEAEEMEADENAAD